jgi:hypothetical protein
LAEERTNRTYGTYGKYESYDPLSPFVLEDFEGLEIPEVLEVLFLVIVVVFFFPLQVASGIFKVLAKSLPGLLQSGAACQADAPQILF